MPCPLLLPGALLLGLIVLGGTASAAGIGLNVSGYARNIPRAVAGAHSPRVGVQADERARSRLRPATRRIGTDTTGESTATPSWKCADAADCRRSITQGLR
jgi:hypothetical protein